MHLDSVLPNLAIKNSKQEQAYITLAISSIPKYCYLHLPTLLSLHNGLAKKQVQICLISVAYNIVDMATLQEHASRHKKKQKLDCSADSAFVKIGIFTTSSTTKLKLCKDTHKKETNMKTMLCRIINHRKTPRYDPFIPRDLQICLSMMSLLPHLDAPSSNV